MKVCPACKKTYTDEDLNFCLADGATLLKKRGGAKHSRVNEVVAIALLAFAVLTFLCLISYDAGDPTFNSATSQKTKNWIGPVGANFAEALVSISGITAYLFPLLLGLIGWRVFQSEDLRPTKSRIVGYFFFIATASSLAHLIGWHGGITGALFASYSVYFLSTVGATILLGAVFLASVLLITDLSFLGLFGSFELAWANFKVRFDDWKKKRREARSEQISLANERLEKRKIALSEKSLAETPTISKDEPSIATVSRGKTRAAAAGLTQPDLQLAETPSIPTITGSDAVPDTIISDDIPQSEAEEIPVESVKPANELPELPTVVGAEEQPIELTSNAQNFEHYVLPSTQLLTPPAPPIEQKDDDLRTAAAMLSEKTKEFNVAGKVVNICPGPVVTTYEFKPDPGVKYSRVTGLVDDLCLALQAESIRIDRIPGKAYVGIEVPNQKRETIQIREVVESKKFKDSASLLTIALGKTIDGLNYVADLAKMPHLLIAGATGAGKSVGVNSLVVSILYKARPDQVKFIMVDPKRLELGLYADIPHLATPIITDPKRAAVSLKWAVLEMERRYKDLAGYGVRNIDGYNAEAKRRNDLEMWDDTGEPHRTLPYIVIIIDELADLMMVAGKDVEDSITRLAQMARAVGIHLVLATQRPSVDVITGLIKANFPARISFRVSSKVDSRTIIDGNGAECLLGKGDMLFLPPASSQVIRVHGAYVDEKEIGRIVEQVKSQGRPEYDTTITKTEEELDDSGDLPGRRDPLFWDALKCVVSAKRGSTSLLQRHLRIGYGRAAAILDAMVREGYIGDMDGSTRARPVLQKAYDDLQDLAEMEQV
ncbi:MAG: cell division protein FtsK [Acidobacteria bacterium]|nr:MAG: cell division protein FtsK [Acidobacteriota bacterium]